MRASNRVHDTCNRLTWGALDHTYSMYIPLRKYPWTSSLFAVLREPGTLLLGVTVKLNKSSGLGLSGVKV